jgi:hypothetical protein
VFRAAAFKDVRAEVGMSEPAVKVDGLLKVFDVPECEPGRFGLRCYSGASA